MEQKSANVGFRTSGLLGHIAISTVKELNRRLHKEADPLPDGRSDMRPSRIIMIM